MSSQGKPNIYDLILESLHHIIYTIFVGYKVIRNILPYSSGDKFKKIIN
jgi:hypothetical protein